MLYVDDGTLYRAFRQAGENGTRICMHAENGIVIDEIVKAAVADGKLAPKYHALTRPTRMEAEGVYRAIAIAEVADVPLHIVHLSCSDALEQVKRRAQPRRGRAWPRPARSICSSTASYLRQPRLRGRQVGHDARRCARSGTRTCCGTACGSATSRNVATDHCPFCMKDQKELGKDSFTKIPNGAPGVENRMSLIYHGGVRRGPDQPEPLRRAHLDSRGEDLRPVPEEGNHRRRQRRGHRRVRSGAQGVTISVNNPDTHHMRVDYSAYEGFEVQGCPETVLSRGRVIVEKGKGCTKGGGRFVKRAHAGELLR